MSFSLSDVIGRLSPSDPPAFYGSLAIVAVLLLSLLWMWRLRRRKARRAELRVWHPGRRGDAEGQAEAVDEILEPPAWLANATIRRRVTPSPLPQTTPVERAEKDDAALPPIEPASLADPATTPAADAPAPPVLVPAPPVPSKPQASADVPMPSAGYATRVGPVRGSSFLSPPTPSVTVRVDAAEMPLSAGISSQQPDIPVAPEAPAVPGPAADMDQACAHARRLAAQGRQAEALAVLRPVLDDHAPATAWAMAGWCAWNLAEESPAPLALATEASQAFERALTLEPEREGALARMVGRCRLLQADVDLPARREAHLAAAVDAYERGFAQGMASESALLEWAKALYEFAVSSPSERPALLAKLDTVLARGPEVSQAAAGWSRQRARAAWLRAMDATTAAERDRHHRHAALHAERAHVASPDTAARDEWLAESIGAERRYLNQLSPAARSNGYRSLAQRVSAQLPETQGNSPSLAWVHVLADTSQWLQGPAARQRLGEADTLLARLEARSNDAPEERQAVSFARAYYLRQRAMHEPASMRREVLAQAARLLAHLRDEADFPAQPAVILEQAEVALLLAGEGRDAAAYFEEAAGHATAAADLPQTRVAGFRVLLTALLGWQQHQPVHTRMQQIALVAQWLAQADVPPAAETLRLLAAAALAGQDVAEAARLSAAAWEAGAEGHALLPGWRHADAEWARQLVESAERSAWEHQHRLLRLAASSC